MRKITIMVAIAASMAFEATAEEGLLQCTRIYSTNSVNTFGVYNNCGKCMVASLSWCDGRIKTTQVQAHSNVVLRNCVGNISLVGERPCASLQESEINEVKKFERENLVKE